METKTADEKYDLLIRNARLACPQGELQGDLAAADGRIVRIAPRIEAKADEVVDAGGLLLLPGGVDAHTHLDLTVAAGHVCDGWQKGSAAALAGGTTTVIEHIGFGPAGCSPDQPLSAAFAAAEAECGCDFRIHGVLQQVDAETESWLLRAKARGVVSWKAYMTYDFAIHGVALRRLCRISKAAGVLLCVHCEDDAMLAAARQALVAAGKISPRYHATARPAACEAAAIRELLAAARAAGDAPVYIVHLSSAAGLAEIRAARQAGQQNVYCETCPQYLLLDETRYLDPEQALRCTMSPPLRSRADADALWQALADGEIDVVATDHCAFSLAQKHAHSEDFRLVPNGAPGVEERMTLLLSAGVACGRISLARAVEVLAANPARLFGLAGRKGALQEGYDADLVLFDPTAPFAFLDQNLHGGADYTLYHGMPLTGCIRRVWTARAARGRRQEAGGRPQTQ